VVSSGLEGGGWGDDGRDGNGFLMPRACEYARVCSKKKTRQNSRDAVAWASYAPMRLRRQNSRGGMPKLPIIARSEPNGGGEVMNKMGRRAHLLAQNRFLIFGLRFRKRGKPQEGLRKKRKKEADSKTAILILGKNKG